MTARRLLTLAALVAAAMTPAHASTPTGGSVGTPQDGTLEGGFEVPLTGAHHAFYGPVEARGTHFATLEVAALVAPVATTVSRELPGPPLVLGDLSADGGGRLARHASHTSGRDIDVLFYVLDARGEPVPARGFRRFDGDGRCRDDGCALQLDVPRTWWAVRTLVASREPAVQYLFVSNGLRALLLGWAERAGEHPELLRRARRVLRQPRDAAAHDDHLHVRTYCTPSDHAVGCQDTGTRWPWVDARGTAAPITPAR